MEPPNTPSATTRFGIFFLIGGVTLIFVFWGILRYLKDSKHPAPAAQRTSKQVTSVTPTPVSKATEDAKATEKANLSERVSQALAVLRDPNNSNKKAALDALKEALRGADPKVAVAVIREFLDTKQDAPTGLQFKVGDNHELDESPTMRTFLMDQLGDISLEAKLGDAAEVARATLGSKDSSDEWALAMRNLALSDPDGSRSFLAGKVKEMLAYPAWQQQPSTGYLEAFDVAAYAGDPGVVANLGMMLSSPNGSLQRASRVALQRLSALAPEQVAEYLNANPNVLSDYPNLRADYMGNVDLSSPAQLTQAETYLARTDVTDAEKNKFIGRLGLPAGFVSNTLVTPEDITPMPILEQRALANRTAAAWLASGKYPTLQPALQKMMDYTSATATPAGP